MTRSVTSSVCFLSALVFAGCGDVAIGDDGTRPDATADQAADDSLVEPATCTGANPASRSCRAFPGDCIPSSCTCTDGSWHCTADCPVSVPLCADGGAPDLPPDTASGRGDAPQDQPPVVETCSGPNPAEQACRKTVTDCIPSSCACMNGFWQCTADCPANVPLCKDGGAPDLPPDGPSCAGTNPAAATCRKTATDCLPSACSCDGEGTWVCTADCRGNVPLCADGGATDVAPDAGTGRPTDEQSCIEAVGVPGCDIAPRPSAVVTSAAGGPLLAKLEVLSGPCGSMTCSGCSSMTVVGTSSATAGAACLVQVTSTDGRSQTVALSVEAKVMPFTCCGYPTDGHGVWIAPTVLSFSPGTVTVDFAADGGAGSATSCAECAATEVCVQSFDGMCGGGRVACKAVSEACRTKLSASGAKSCKSIPECESELCLTPSYRCTDDAPCGSEAKEAQVYCYGI